ncbi:Ti type entry exclusion protein TrbK [Bradyrhizobium diazoefficiens]|uniref:Entry exclusion protein TrbK n=2 Tax=Nitrobacteraceae TaxID=41294 RepID=A0A7Z0QM43_9BRAD|nr:MULTISPECIES: entry exclusion protein TrbK [Bradyrhizobium]MBR0924344.1 entry exclusion protein TrbK [Bradyrhizobium diazoefficiens]MBR0948093.1 entry exclusion protein TrbK [Bradyrhizobium liaoningense]UGX99497.1 entry exclusion protein TrbK [Bradyrhizobium barranii subsp. barranii]UQE03803.1 entry exclusion protein TrbK [Bradyrhizobium japonicum]WLB24591.1 entry exclusion protein TrbK [Bradyrhizobium japonicum]
MRPSTIIIVILAIGAGAAGAWLVFAPRAYGGQPAASRSSDFFKPPQDYETSGGQQMKPRW